MPSPSLQWPAYFPLHFYSFGFENVCFLHIWRLLVMLHLAPAGSCGDWRLVVVESTRRMTGPASHELKTACRVVTKRRVTVLEHRCRLPLETRRMGAGSGALNLKKKKNQILIFLSACKNQEKQSWAFNGETQSSMLGKKTLWELFLWHAIFL